MTLALKAFEKFEQETAEYPYNFMCALKEALTNIGNTKPSNHLKKQWSMRGGEALISDQVKRDMLIVDYMVQQKEVPFEIANDMWADWEDYEFELKGGE